VDALELPTFDLYALSNESAAAIAFAARQPSRVRRLVLWSPYAKGSDILTADVLVAARAAVTADWAFYCQNSAALSLGFDHLEVAEALAPMMTNAISQAYGESIFDGFAPVDVTAALPDLIMPVLVLHPRSYSYPALDKVVALTAELRDAR